MLTETTSSLPFWINWLPGPIVAILSYLILWWRHVSVFEANTKNSVKAVDARVTVMAANRNQDIDALIARVDHGREARATEFAELRRDFREATAELRAVAGAVSRANAEQAIINTITTKTLDSLSAKQEVHSRQLADITATQTLITELFKRQEERRQ